MANPERPDGPDLPTSNEFNPADATPPPQPDGRNKHNPEVRRALEILNTLLGIVGIVGMFYLPGSAPKIAVLTLLAVLTSLLFKDRINECSKAVYFLITSIIMAGVLAGVLVYWLVESAGRDPQEQEWASWEARVTKGVADCEGEEYAEVCMADAIAVPYPSPDSASPLASLYGDTRAGRTIMRMGRVRAMLETRIGVMPAFTGAGFAVPNDPNKSYWKARVPEYLVRNLSDKEPEVWSWQLDPASSLRMSVAQVVADAPLPEYLRGRDRKLLADGVKDNCGLADQTPAVIRFSRFQEGFYRNRLGRDERKRVFVMHLCAVRHLSIEEAAHLSGYQLAPGDLRPDKGPERLFVWIYFPGHADHITEATWGNILRNFKHWVRES